MIIEEEDPEKCGNTAEIQTVQKSEQINPAGKEKKSSTLKPRRLFPVEDNPPPEGSQMQKPPKKGKQVLSSDARLHLQKLRQKKLLREQEIEGTEGSDEELKLLEAETKRLEAKLEKIREIHRLQQELKQTSIKEGGDEGLGYIELSEDDEDYYYDEEEVSNESIYSRPRRPRTVSSGGTPQGSMSTDSISQEEFLKMQEDMAQLRDLVKTQSRFEAPVESPLSRSIEKAKIYRTLKTPALDQFDGSTDPSGFLNTFDGRMASYGHSEVARCQFFSTCLQGTALRWYNNLPSRSIDSWTTLKTKLQTRFSSNYKGGKITASLITMRQRSSESLRSYLGRFRQAISEITDLEEPLAVNYLAAGIDGSRHGILLEELIEKHPQHLHAAFQIVEHRMTLQEAVGNRKGQPRERKDKEFTKLTVDKATILAILKTEPDFRPPRPMKPGRPPSSRYCDYHEDTGHTTEQCYQLSNLIESKIRRGHFILYIEGQDQNQQRQDDRIVDVIFGSYAAGGMSNNSRKSYAREVCSVNPSCPKKCKPSPSLVISFSDEDYSPNIIRGHQDALVITAKIGTNIVKKILVDNDSSVDILYHHALARMDTGERKLENIHSPLYGFTGNEVKLVGTIDLPVLFDTMPCQVWKIVKFHVISANSSHNAILGRTTISALEAITSIPHLKMKFPTEFGVGEMCGDQAIDPNNIIDIPRDPSFFPVGETVEVSIVENFPDKTVKVGKDLNIQIKDELTRLLREFSDIFAWSPSDMPDLNRACPKDYYPLPNIDQLIDATAGHELLSFMDAFSGYNQIRMDDQDWEQTAFITHRGVFAYRNMPFGLINAGATFQRMMDEIFKKQLGRNLEVYVDDMITKSKSSNNHCSDLRETFENVRRNNMRLNSLKCSFGLTSGKFLGFLVSQRGIEADPSQIKAIFEMKDPSTIKEVQRLTGCIAALRRFIPQASKKCSPFFKVIKEASRNKKLIWEDQCKESFEAIKAFLTSPPVLERALPRETLKVYISASDVLVASVFVKDVEGREAPVYYVSHTLKDAETHYPHVEKLVYALVVASRKLRHYFQGRLIKVMTDQPLKRALKLSFPVTNNVAGYEALLAGLCLSIELEVKILEIFGDSQLVAKQLQGEFKAHDTRMSTYLKLAISLLEKVQSWTIKNICKEDNQWADVLSKLASSVVTTSEAIYVDERKVPFIDLGPPFPNILKINEISSMADWRQPFLEYILQNKLPQDKNEARSISYKAKNYCVLENKLYRWGLVEPLLRCLGPEDAHLSMVEVHTGICGDHLGGKNLALKIVRQGLFWPTMRSDYENFVRKCKSCQLYGSVSHQPSVEMIMVEARPLAKIREKEKIEFLMEYIMFRFGIPRVVVTDNGTQFVGDKFIETLSQLKIKHIKSSVAYPQANGQVEVTNRIILQGIKKRVDELPRPWVEELPNVLWSYRTTPRSSTGISPFKMAFGLEAVSPVEVSLNSPRVEYFDVEASQEGIQLHNVLMEEVRDEASKRVLQQQARTTSYFNKKVKVKQFLVGDLVLRESAASQPAIT
ncbi:uncharacterized protein LOC141719230 [Apium graveolens]|uniref:uncharacterized protein LOC141719230 n=1 Tax=Apium graveolens TaxID=4045 RepID=UPI003D7A4DD7